MKTYTICGSMRFSQEMQGVALYLETVKGYNVLQCTYSPHGNYLCDEHISAIRNAHFKKIDLSDGIYVINLYGYIGAATREDIEYAIKHGKEVLYYCD